MLSSIYVSEELNKKLVVICQEVAYKAVNYCASKYNFNAEEVYRELGLDLVKVEHKKEGKRKTEKVSVSVAKPTFPLPYNGEMNGECCSALRQNNGLYTQCTGVRRDGSNFCKGCASQMQKTGAEVPEYGTIEMRKAVGIFEYVDPKGRKPVAYTKVMKKYKLTEEQVLDEAKKLNMEINREHFAVPEETKRGRPSKEKETKEKGTRGRPKKSKKVVEIDGDTEDLFATLVANANEEVVEDVKSEDEVVLKKEKLAAEKAEKLAAEKAEKLAKKEAERLAREEKKKAEEEEKALKKAAAEQAKKEKELAAEQAKKEKEEAKKAKEAAKKEKASKKDEKVSKKDEKVSAEETGEKDEEPDVVKKIEFEGKKYLKSKKTGIIYDYIEYTKNGEQVVVGKWNDATNKIVFNAAEEEEDEEEYDM
jgi:chemotaxis protein histidine kinase CheA